MATGRKTGGRQKGSLNKKTQALQAKVEASGLTPLDVMLDNMRFAHEQAGKLLEGLLAAGAKPADEKFDQFKELIRFRGMAQECAKDAAPYIHARVTAAPVAPDPPGQPDAADTPRAPDRGNVGEIVSRFRAASVAQPNGNGAVKH